MENPNYLKLGDTGHQVIKLQKSLIKKGYALKETGIFDSTTFRAVAELQRASGLEVDGYVGKQIWQLLDGITPLNYYNPTDIPAPNFTLYPYNALNNEYYKEVYRKDKIIIKSSCTSSHPLSWVGRVESNRIMEKSNAQGSAFAIGGKLESYWLYESKIRNAEEVNGSIYKFFDEENWSNVVKINPNGIMVNSTSIGITLCNMGGLIVSSTGMMLNSFGLPVNDKDVFDLGRNYKGYRYFHNYTNEQIESLYNLIRWIMSKYNIKISRSVYGQPLWWDISRDALNSRSGIWNGNNFSEICDIYPHPLLIEMLNKL